MFEGGVYSPPLSFASSPHLVEEGGIVVIGVKGDVNLGQIITTVNIINITNMAIVIINIVIINIVIINIVNIIIN